MFLKLLQGLALNLCYHLLTQSRNIILGEIQSLANKTYSIGVLTDKYATIVVC